MDRELRSSGVLAAAVAAIGLLILGFVPWWGAGQSAVTGWEAVGAPGDVVIAVVAASGLLGGCTLGLPAPGRRRVASLLAGVALVGAVVVLWRWASWTAGLAAANGANAGAPLAALGCLGVAGALMGAAHGSALIGERVGHRILVRVIVAAACAGLIVSLLLPWARFARAGEAGPRLAAITLTGWQSWNGAAWLLVLDATAIAVIAGAVRTPRRMTLGALTAAAWLAAAITVVMPWRPIGLVRLPFGVQRTLTAREGGFYLALGSAAVIALVLLATLTATSRQLPGSVGAGRSNRSD